MTIALSQTYTAVGVNGTSSFLATNGAPPYTYSVLAGGAGGSIIGRTGVYTAPAVASSSPKFSYDTIQAKDKNNVTTTAQILVGTPLILFCDIIQQGLGLANGRVYLWDQKIFQPTDYNLYIAISEMIPKPFGNNTVVTTDNQGNYTQNQSVNIMSVMNIDIMSRGPEARDRKAEVLFALNSNYSEQQQEANSFFIGRISKNIIDLSNVDGAAIPYRYQFSCQIQYTVGKVSQIGYYNKFSGYALTVNN